MRRWNKARLLVTQLSQLRPVKFGPLSIRQLPDGGALGDLSILHEHLPPWSRLPTVYHRHTAELVYCLSGSMTAELGHTKKQRVRAGALIVIPPGVRHRFVTGATSCDCLSMFSPALSLSAGADVHTDPPPRKPLR